jgi:GDPmannose 4,6-dehydratase
LPLKRAPDGARLPARGGLLCPARFAATRVAETKNALITGLTGQDGSYLAELLLKKGYRVFGLVRRLSTPNMGRIEHFADDVELLEGDLTDSSSLLHAIRASTPHEAYNLAAQSFVGTSWKQPILTCDVSGTGAVRLMEALHQLAPDARFYQASTSEMFGKVKEEPQTETTPFHPRSPYGFAKVMAFYAVMNYRESYGMFAANGILFNHESPRRGIEFVTRKISYTVAKIALGKAKELRLGNLDAVRDWGYAGDYVDAMWRIMTHETPDDFVVATGEAHSVGEFCRLAFERAGMEKWERYVKVDPKFVRPAEVHTLRGNAAKARRELGWQPKVPFKKLVTMMVDADLALVKSGGHPY